MSVTVRHNLKLMWSQQSQRLTFISATKVPPRKTVCILAQHAARSNDTKNCQTFMQIQVARITLG